MRRWGTVGILWTALAVGGCLEAPPENATCGDGEVDGDEACDDDNDDDTDGCLSTCELATCGDGVVRAGVEDCDEDSVECVDCVFCPDAPEFRRSPNSGNCYQRIDSPSLTWDDARDACEENGDHLATLVGPTEQERFEDWPVWIGLRAQTETEEWEWVTGEPFVFEGEPWAPGEPTGPSPSIEPCVYDTGTGPDDGWNNVACDFEFPYACEHQRWRVREEDAHAYRIGDRAADWEVASTRCELLGGHLVEIEDAGEQAFVDANFDGVYWIGAVTDDGGDEFVWQSGAPMDYTNWRDGEPDALEEQACAHRGQAGSWRSEKCARVLGWVCEIDG